MKNLLLLVIAITSLNSFGNDVTEEEYRLSVSEQLYYSSLSSCYTSYGSSTEDGKKVSELKDSELLKNTMLNLLDEMQVGEVIAPNVNGNTPSITFSKKVKDDFRSNRNSYDVNIYKRTSLKFDYDSEGKKASTVYFLVDEDYVSLQNYNTAFDPVFAQRTKTKKIVKFYCTLTSDF